jgi:peptidoglycan/xylan/chitin deacetylase (PgdA/CDA1 family)
VRTIESVKSAVKTALAAPPVWRLRNRRRRRPGCVVVLYHRIGRAADPFPNLDVARFAAQMRWLKANCDVIDPDDLQKRAATPGNDRGLPAVLVTFDDGYRDYYDNAYPVLKSCGIRTINFLCTQFVDDSTITGWWDRLFLAVQQTSRPTIEVPWHAGPFVLDQAGKAEFLRTCKLHIKGLPDHETGAVTADICDRLGVEPRMLKVPRQMMTWEEVRRAADFTSYGGHTHSHVIVSQLDAATLDHEVRTCRERILVETGSAPRTFAYPNGRAVDFNDAAKAALRRHGFDTAFAAIEGLNDARTDWMEIRRIPGGDTVADLAWRVSRLWQRSSS